MREDLYKDWHECLGHGTTQRRHCHHLRPYGPLVSIMVVQPLNLVLISSWIQLISTTAKDGMDQSKWCVPRSKTLTKSLAKYERPKTKVQGVWAHNICLVLFVLDPRSQADGSMVVETLCCALKKAHPIARACGKTHPVASCCGKLFPVKLI